MNPKIEELTIKARRSLEAAKEIHQAFHRAFNHRQVADYSSSMAVGIDQAKLVLKNTDHMLQTIFKLTANKKGK